MSDEKPGTVGRLGEVIYWLGCALGILSVPAGLLAAYVVNEPFGIALLGVSILFGFGFWLLGRAARNILKGD